MESYTSEVRCSTTEWANQLILRISPHIINGFQSIFNESVELCEKNNEPSKYLMTYQNLLSRIPHWNQTIIDNEQNRIIKKSNCPYLEDLITCIHVNQLRLLSYARAGTEPQKIEINIPELSLFLHRVYINIARKLYSNIYLFEIDISSLERQKRNREFELMVEACIMNTIRDNLPIEELLRKYIDETQEIDVKREEVIIEEPKKKEEEEKNKLNNELYNISGEPDTIIPTEVSNDKPIPNDSPDRTAVIDISKPEELPIEKYHNEVIPIETSHNEDKLENISSSSDIRLSWDPRVKDNDTKDNDTKDKVDFRDLEDVDTEADII
jgi:hypothetical protein